MRFFTRLLAELKDTVAKSKVGSPVSTPSLLNKIEIDGKAVSYFQMGMSNPEKVILIHGFGGFFMDWPRLMAPLAKRFHVIAPDLPGWGFSDINKEFLAQGMNADVHFIHHFIQKLQLKDVSLIGVSYGAGVAWACAALHTPDIKRLLLLSPMPPFPLKFMHSPLYLSVFKISSYKQTYRLGHKLLNKFQFKLICKESLRHARLLDSFYLDLGYCLIKQPKVAEVLHAHAFAAKYVDWQDWADRMKTIRVPTTVMQGREDRIFSLASAQYVHSLIPDSELIEVHDCGHAIIFDQHRRVAEYILHHW